MPSEINLLSTGSKAGRPIPWTRRIKKERESERERLQKGRAMRPLTDDETKVLFEKLANYIGKNIEQLINRPDEKCCFRLHKDRVYYVRCVLRSLSTHQLSVATDNTPAGISV